MPTFRYFFSTNWLNGGVIEFASFIVERSTPIVHSGEIRDEIAALRQAHSIPALTFLSVARLPTVETFGRATGPYPYQVSYAFRTGEGSGFGNCESTRNSPILTLADLRATEEDIRAEQFFARLVIISIIPMLELSPALLAKLNWTQDPAFA